MSRILETALTPAQRQECEANDLRLAMTYQSEDATMKPVACETLIGLYCDRRDIQHEAACQKQCQVCAESNGTWDRGPLTQPAELFDDAAFAAFDLERGREGKGPTLARRDDQQAAALDLQALDVIRRAGL